MLVLGLALRLVFSNQKARVSVSVSVNVRVSVNVSVRVSVSVRVLEPEGEGCAESPENDFDQNEGHHEEPFCGVCMNGRMDVCMDG